jgi:hypothetical protein
MLRMARAGGEREPPAKRKRGPRIPPHPRNRAASSASHGVTLNQWGITVNGCPRRPGDRHFAKDASAPLHRSRGPVILRTTVSSAPSVGACRRASPRRSLCTARVRAVPARDAPMLIGTGVCFVKIDLWRMICDFVLSPPLYFVAVLHKGLRDGDLRLLPHVPSTRVERPAVEAPPGRSVITKSLVRHGKPKVSFRRRARAALTTVPANVLSCGLPS